MRLAELSHAGGGRGMSKKRINSRPKGARREREAAAYLTRLGFSSTPRSKIRSAPSRTPLRAARVPGRLCYRRHDPAMGKAVKL